jgi:hypothetical protein
MVAAPHPSTQPRARLEAARSPNTPTRGRAASPEAHMLMPAAPLASLDHESVNGTAVPLTPRLACRANGRLRSTPWRCWVTVIGVWVSLR